MTVLAVIDVETTGLTPPAEVVQIGRTIMVGEGKEWGIDVHDSRNYRPLNGNPPEARAVHHLGPNDWAQSPICTAEYLQGSLVLVEGRPDYIVAHNWAMEAQWFTPEIIGDTPAICTMKAAMRVWPDAPGFGNQVLRYWLEDQGRIHDLGALAQPAHSAGPDTYVTAHNLRELLQHATLEEMAAWTLEPRLLPKCPIGKFRGAAWSDVEAGFLTWMLAQASMEEDLKWNARRELERRRSQ